MIDFEKKYGDKLLTAKGYKRRLGLGGGESGQSSVAAMGVAIHEMVQSEYAKRGKLQAAELTLVDMPNNMVGSIDIYTTNDEVIEIKTTSISEIVSMKAPKLEHKLQLIYYLKSLNKKSGTLLYVAREATGFRKSFTINIEGESAEVIDGSVEYLKNRRGTSGLSSVKLKEKMSYALDKAEESHLTVNQWSASWEKHVKEVKKLQGRELRRKKIHEFNKEYDKKVSKGRLITRDEGYFSKIMRHALTSFGSPWRRKGEWRNPVLRDQLRTYRKQKSYKLVDRYREELKGYYQSLTIDDNVSSYMSRVGGDRSYNSLKRELEGGIKPGGFNELDKSINEVVNNLHLQKTESTEIGKIIKESLGDIKYTKTPELQSELFLKTLQSGLSGELGDDLKVRSARGLDQLYGNAHKYSKELGISAEKFIEGSLGLKINIGKREIYRGGKKDTFTNIVDSLAKELKRDSVGEPRINSLTIDSRNELRSRFRKELKGKVKPFKFKETLNGPLLETKEVEGYIKSILPDKVINSKIKSRDPISSFERTYDRARKRALKNISYKVDPRKEYLDLIKQGRKDEALELLSKRVYNKDLGWKGIDELSNSIFNYAKAVDHPDIVLSSKVVSDGRDRIAETLKTSSMKEGLLEELLYIDTAKGITVKDWDELYKELRPNKKVGKGHKRIYAKDEFKTVKDPHFGKKSGDSSFGKTKKIIKEPFKKLEKDLLTNRDAVKYIDSILPKKINPINSRSKDPITKMEKSFEYLRSHFLSSFDTEIDPRGKYTELIKKGEKKRALDIFTKDFFAYQKTLEPHFQLHNTIFNYAKAVNGPDVVLSSQIVSDGSKKIESALHLPMMQKKLMRNLLQIDPNKGTELKGWDELREEVRQADHIERASTVSRRQAGKQFSNLQKKPSRLSRLKRRHSPSSSKKPPKNTFKRGYSPRSTKLPKDIFFDIETTIPTGKFGMQPQVLQFAAGSLEGSDAVSHINRKIGQEELHGIRERMNKNLTFLKSSLLEPESAVKSLEILENDGLHGLIKKGYLEKDYVPELQRRWKQFAPDVRSQISKEFNTEGVEGMLRAELEEYLHGTTVKAEGGGREFTEAYKKMSKVLPQTDSVSSWFKSRKQMMTNIQSFVGEQSKNLDSMDVSFLGHNIKSFDIPILEDVGRIEGRSFKISDSFNIIDTLTDGSMRNVDEKIAQATKDGGSFITKLKAPEVEGGVEKGIKSLGNFALASNLVTAEAVGEYEHLLAPFDINTNLLQYVSSKQMNKTEAKQLLLGHAQRVSPTYAKQAEDILNVKAKELIPELQQVSPAIESLVNEPVELIEGKTISSINLPKVQHSTPKKLFKELEPLLDMVGGEGTFKETESLLQESKATFEKGVDKVAPVLEKWGNNVDDFLFNIQKKLGIEKITGTKGRGMALVGGAALLLGGAISFLSAASPLDIKPPHPKKMRRTLISTSADDEDHRINYPEGKMAQNLRHKYTDFGSGYQGIIGSGLAHMKSILSLPNLSRKILSPTASAVKEAEAVLPRILSSFSDISTLHPNEMFGSLPITKGVVSEAKAVIFDTGSKVHYHPQVEMESIKLLKSTLKRKSRFRKLSSQGTEPYFRSIQNSINHTTPVGAM